MPADVGHLIAADGLDFQVQTSTTRIFSDADFRAVGATVTDDLSDCDVVLAIKEIPVEQLRGDTAYLFFSHTVKGQPHSMPLLRRILDTGATLIDYEPIVDAAGLRLVHFGRFAGLAGMVDALVAFGRRWATQGVQLPFLDLQPAYAYDNLADALAAVAAVGRRIATEGLPDAVGPLVIGVTGYGHVGQGVSEVLDRLPRLDIAPGSLGEAFLAEAESTQVHVAVFTEHDTVARTDGAAFTVADYRADPSAFVSICASTARWLSILVNSVLWQPTAPRLLTVEELQVMSDSGSRLDLIADLSCDIRGGIEATVRATTSDEPVFVFDPRTGLAPAGFTGPGVAILAVDNLPCEFPLDSSVSFSEALRPLIPAIARADFSVPFEALDLPPELKGAVVAHRGSLTPGFAELDTALRAAGA